MADATNGVVQYANDPITFLDVLKRQRVDPVIARLIRMRSAGLSRPSSPLTAETGPGVAVLRDVRRGRRTLDPQAPEEGDAVDARRLLRQALADARPQEGLDVGAEAAIRQRLRAQGVDSEAYIVDRRKRETDLLTAFQSSPGNVLRRDRKSARWAAQPLVTAGEPKEWWPEGNFKPPQVYDAATVRLLAEAQSSPRRPPTNLPPIFDDRYYAKGAKGQEARWHGRQAISEDSALSRAEREQEELAEMIGHIDKALNVLDSKIAAYTPSPSVKKNSGRRSARRPRRER